MRRRVLALVAVVVFGLLVFSPFSLQEVLLSALLRLNLGGDGELLAEVLDLLANIVLFAPVGAVIARLTRNWAIGALVGFVSSCVIEYVQIFIPDRTPSFVDIATDTAGAVIGALIAVSSKSKPNGGGPSADTPGSEPTLQH